MLKSAKCILCTFFMPLLICADIVPDGYWKKYHPAQQDHAAFVVVRENRGFYCILDGKSSFRFEIKGDSMTTPMNGMDAIRWMPGSDDLVITGEEKSEIYYNRFARFWEAQDYPQACLEEERKLYGSVTGLIRRPGTPAGLRQETGPFIDALGRTRSPVPGSLVPAFLP